MLQQLANHKPQIDPASDVVHAPHLIHFKHRAPATPSAPFLLLGQIEAAKRPFGPAVSSPPIHLPARLPSIV